MLKLWCYQFLSLFLLVGVAGCSIGHMKTEPSTYVSQNTHIVLTQDDKFGGMDEAAKLDQNTILDAVIGAMNNSQQSLPISWKNDTTGSEGEILQIEPQQYNAKPCHYFKITRESFNGAALYAGHLCLGEDGKLMMQDFIQVDE